MKVLNLFLLLNIISITLSYYFTDGLDESIQYIGVDEHDYIFLDQEYSCPLGMDYNSYIIMDKKIAIIDTVPKKYCSIWINNLYEVLGIKTPDYIIIQSIEPDQSGCLEELIKLFPNIEIIASSKFFQMSWTYFNTDFQEKRYLVKEGETLSIGDHEFLFIYTPFVRWPETIMTYEKETKTLFSGKLFGNFGGSSEEKWADEARRYYFAMLAGHPKHIHLAVDKVSVVDVKVVCPFNGPLFKGNKVAEYVKLYDTWSSNVPEQEGVLIVYNADHGDFKPLIGKLAEIFKEKGKSVKTVNIAYNYADYVVADAFRYSKLVIATTSFNNEMNPYLKSFINYLIEREYQNRVVGIIGNGTWTKFINFEIMQKLNELRNIKIIDSIEIINPLSCEKDNELEKFAKSLFDTKVLM